MIPNIDGQQDARKSRYFISELMAIANTEANRPRVLAGDSSFGPRSFVKRRDTNNRATEKKMGPSTRLPGSSARCASEIEADSGLTGGALEAEGTARGENQRLLGPS